MKINNQTIGLGVILTVIMATGGAYLNIRDRLTRMESQLEILAPVAIDHMVAIELQERGVEVKHPKPPELPSIRPIQPKISNDDLDKIRREKRSIYNQRS